MIALVTGSAGFLGRHMVKGLLQRGYTVWGADTAVERGRWDALELFRGTSDRYDLVVHCAAVSPHRAAIDEKALAVGAGNLELDAAMFQWAARTKPGRVVYFSSSAAYPVRLQTREWLETYGPRPLAEHQINLTQWGKTGDWSPDAIYGWVKLTGEHLAAAYRQQGGAVTVLRPFSGYGEDQAEDFPFGAFAARARRRDDPFTIWGDGDQVRDWIHVDDVVGATLAAVEQGVDGPLNLCTGRGVSVWELAAMFAAAAGYVPCFDFLGDKPAGVAYRVGDPTRMLEVYTPKVSLEEGVRRALAHEAVTDGAR